MAKTAQLNVEIPQGLKRRLKLRAVERDLTVTKAVIEAVEKWAGRSARRKRRRRVKRRRRKT